MTKPKCGKECDYICQQPDGHGFCGKRASTSEPAPQAEAVQAQALEVPMQPLVVDDHGVIRFKENAIVRRLVEFGRSRGMGLNELATMDFSDQDQMQLAQLIGYSVDGYGTLSYVSDESYNAASDRARSLASASDAAKQQDSGSVYAVSPVPSGDLQTALSEGTRKLLEQALAIINSASASYEERAPVAAAIRVRLGKESR